MSQFSSALARSRKSVMAVTAVLALTAMAVSVPGTLRGDNGQGNANGKNKDYPFAHGNRWIGGWELAGIASARTGLPVNIAVSRSASALPDGNTSSQRPNYVLGAPIYAPGQNINNWFNLAAFSAPANGTWGNLGRYIANGPGAYEIDSSLQKRFRVGERLALNFRAAAFNLYESSGI
jgi:hypothetical protein